MSTNEEYNRVTARCRSIFIDKMQDYGASWRIFRLHGITDQLYIKACNIRQRQETGISLVGDDIEGNLRAIVNYGITAIIQTRKGYADAVDITNDEAAALYDEVLNEARELMNRKNHDYGEAWREMSREGIVDMILAKIIRIKTILANNGKTLASEGVEGNYFDIINYAIFDLIHYEK
ncbi:MAG: DUF1599 domain-containing protein [Paludibacteraceae bacterium]|nr:DUF1599 domain-containing protein [Paludibacteraceae bacterium]MBR1480718.1 DUF1599 domain-containing protein [Paludibacteraceae bacterium]